ncbi:MAG TPA: MFS transporter [Gammaproteobacteria bacterium]|nr:MFS transporter [Gammaproteobacteria bacterium]
MSICTQKLQPNFTAICLLSALFPFYAFFQMTVLNTLSENFIDSFQLSHIGLSALSSAYLYGDALALIPAGLILDRFNTKSIILLSFSLLLISSSLFYFSESFYLAISERFAAGIAHAFALMSCFRIAALHISNDKQGLVMSAILTIAFLGALCAQLPYVWLLKHVGFNNAAFIQIFIGILIFFILKTSIKLPLTQRFENFNLLSAIKNPQNEIAAIFIALMSAPFMLLGALYGLEYLSYNKSLNSFDASFIVSLIFIGTIIGSPFMGWLFDRVKFPKILMMIGVLLTLISCILLFYMQHYLGLIFLMIGFFSSVQVLGYPIIAINNPSGILSTSMGLANFFIMILLGSLQLVTGYIANIVSLEMSLFFIIGLACVLSGICIILVVPYAAINSNNQKVFAG